MSRLARYSDGMDEPRKQPDDPDLDFAEGGVDDDNPTVVEGMRRLADLRKGEVDAPEVVPVRRWTEGMGGERLLTVMATPAGVPAVVGRTQWPVHVTVAGNFRIDNVHTVEVAQLLHSVAQSTARFAVRLGPRELFGPAGNIPVLLASHPEFSRLHRSLALGLIAMQGFAATEPSYWGEGYRPHATVGSSVDAQEGDTVLIRTLTLVSLSGDLGEPVASVDLS